VAGFTPTKVQGPGKDEEPEIDQRHRKEQDGQNHAEQGPTPPWDLEPQGDHPVTDRV